MIARRALLACGCCAAAIPARGQGALICDFAGFGPGGVPPVLGPGTPRAVEEVARVLGVIDFDLDIAVIQVAGGNAFAMRDPWGGRPVIGYNPAFLGQLLQIGGGFAPMSVLAHEVGHHANGDTGWRAGMRHPWARELGADFVSGLALARIGASAEEATRALRAMFSWGSPSHPDTPRRVAAMVDGWQRGDGADRLGFD